MLYAASYGEASAEAQADSRRGAALCEAAHFESVATSASSALSALRKLVPGSAVGSSREFVHCGSAGTQFLVQVHKFVLLGFSAERVALGFGVEAAR